MIERRVLLWSLAAVVGLASCAQIIGIDGEYTEGPSGAGQGGKAGAGAATTSTTGGSAGGQTGGHGGAQSTGGQGGAGTNCAHSTCTVGGPLDASCDSCATAVCSAEADCCSSAWDYECIEVVNSECGIDCGNGVISCADQYAGAPSFQHCDQTPGRCFFRASTQSQTCAQMCTERGGECLDSYNNSGTCGVNWNQQLGCDGTGYNSVICICSRGCGVAAPCSSPQVCTNGSCQ